MLSSTSPIDAPVGAFARAFVRAFGGADNFEERVRCVAGFLLSLSVETGAAFWLSVPLRCERGGFFLDGICTHLSDS